MGVILLAGVYKSANESVQSLWNKDDGRPIFPKIMSLRRFRILTEVFRFDDRESRNHRRQNDKFAPIRDIWTIFVRQLPKYFKLSDSVTVDEQLLSFRGRCSFRQYMPLKPAKYGLKFFAMCCSSTSYVLNILPYLGKFKSTDPPEKNLGFKVVQELVKPIEGTGRNVTTDNFFTSLALARDLKQKRLTLVGTMRHNRKELPSKIKEIKDRQVSSSVHFYKEEAVLVSYKPKPGKNVVLLSSMHAGRVATTDPINNKPAIIRYYNSTKGGADNFDKLAVTYTSKCKTRRWPMCVLANIIDIS
jgi:hypothetical protein